MNLQKTYWHLMDQRRIPSDYEIATSKLHYYKTQGRFEVDVPLQAWYRQYQEGSKFACNDWERFRDPRDTTYVKYTNLQQRSESFIDGLLEQIEKGGYDRELSLMWLKELAQVLGPLRYPLHGFQMIASYLGQMAPSGRMTIAFALQAADEIRRIQRLAYRIAQLQHTHPGFGEDGKSIWQNAENWQPLRKTVERLLVTYDWGEAFTGLNLVVKPLIDQLFMFHFGQLAKRAGDYLLTEMFICLNQDCEWHRQWSMALVKTAIEENDSNKAVLQDWIDRWLLLALPAVQSFAPLYNVTTLDKGANFEHIRDQLNNYYRDYLSQAELKSVVAHSAAKPS